MLVDNIDQAFFLNVLSSVFILNIRSLKCHFYKLAVLLSTINKKFYIIISSEIWLSDNDYFEIHGYWLYIFTNPNLFYLQ